MQSIFEMSIFSDETLNHFLRGFMNSPFPVYAKDSQNEYRYCFWNPAAEKVFGLRSNQVLGKSDFELFGDELGALHQQGDESAMSSGHSISKKDSFKFAHLNQTLSLTTQKFQVSSRFLFGTVEVHTVDDPIQFENEVLKSIFEQIPSAIFAKDQDGEFLFANQAYRQHFVSHLMGVCDDIVGKKDQDIFPESALQIIRDSDQEVMRFNQILEFDEQVKHPEGNRFYLTSKFPIELSVSGKRAVCGVSNDFTDTKRLQSRLQEVNSRFEIAMRALKFGVWDWNAKNNTLFWDSAMHKLYGVKESNFDASIEAFATAIFEEDQNHFLEELEKCIAQRRSEFVCEFRIQRGASEFRILRTEAKCFYDFRGYFERMVGASWDVTEVRDTELKLIRASKMSSLGEMCSGLAHEINNPLAIIMGKTDLIQRKIEKGTLTQSAAVEDIKVVVSTAKRIAAIVSGLRSFAREGGGDPMVNASIQSIVEETIALCGARFEKCEILLETKLPEEEITLFCRPVQISQVILNLLNNAFDAVQALSERWVRISVEADDQSLVVSVTDSGHGIPKKIEDKIMHPFFTTKGVGNGVGLGLSIASGIVKEHGGILRVNSQSKNTCFELKFTNEEKKENAA